MDLHPENSHSYNIGWPISESQQTKQNTTWIMSDCVQEDCGSATIGKCMEDILIPQCDIWLQSESGGGAESSVWHGNGLLTMATIGKMAIHMPQPVVASRCKRQARLQTSRADGGAQLCPRGALPSPTGMLHGPFHLEIPTWRPGPGATAWP